MQRIPFFLLLSFFFFHSSAQSLKEIEKNVHNEIYFLASDSLEGRNTGSNGERIASDYIVSQYQLIGVKPLGDNGTYIQAFTFNSGVQYVGENYMHVDRAILKKDSAYFALNFSGSGDISGDVVNVGYGINAQKINYNDYADYKNTGPKVFLIEVSSPDGDSPQSKYGPYTNLQTKVDEAIKHGASAVVFTNTRDDAEDPEKHFDKYVTPVSIPVVFVKKDAYKKYFLPSNNLIRLSVHLDKVERTGHNVIGFIDNQAKTTVVIGAHYDHLGYGQDGNSLYRGSPAIHNGADDNASGTAGVLELARILMHSNDKSNNYIFINFSGEELGLVGSKYWVNHATYDTAKINYMINMDMIGRYNPDKGVEISGLGTSPAAFNFIRILSYQNLKFKLGENGTGPTDHTSFYFANIPVLNFFTGTHEDYHKPTDKADKINYPAEAKIISLITVIVDSLNNKGVLPFSKTQEQDSTDIPKFKVRLGIIPDYLYEGVGLRVDGVDDGLPASKAGILKGDVIMQLGDIPVSDIMSYMKGLAVFKKGDTTKVIVKRGDQQLTFTLTF